MEIANPARLGIFCEHFDRFFSPLTRHDDFFLEGFFHPKMVSYLNPGANFWKLRKGNQKKHMFFMSGNYE